MASGNAAPIAKRKKGNTRATHVMPATSGLNAYGGGGVCAWNIHAGSPQVNTILAHSTIPAMVRPRIMSIDAMRPVLALILINLSG